MQPYISRCPRGSHMMAVLRLSYLSFSTFRRARIVSPGRSGNPLRTTRNGSPPVWASSVVIVRQFFGGQGVQGLTVTLDTDQLATRAYYCAARGACPDSFKFPETYIVDKGGRLVAYVVGPRNWSQPAARSFLERLIEE